MHNSMALRDNLGDITAKVTAQSIAASLVGTAIGIGLSQLTGFETVPGASRYSLTRTLTQIGDSSCRALRVCLARLPAHAVQGGLQRAGAPEWRPASRALL